MAKDKNAKTVVDIPEIAEEKTPVVQNNKAYVVKKGDTIASVATKHGISVQTLKAKNELKSFKLEVGQKLEF